MVSSGEILEYSSPNGLLVSPVPIQDPLATAGRTSVSGWTMEGYKGPSAVACESPVL